MVPLYLLILVFVHGPPGCNSLWTVTKSTAKSGGAITIPCHYHRMFRDHVKYWCKGRTWALCRVMASTDPRRSRGDMSITDIPEELVFTVTMKNLQETDTNRYWCALKVGAIGKPDVKVSVDLTVTQGSPDLSVVDELVSVEEGGSVSVQCLYSDTLRGKEKKWCRSGDRHSCQTQTDTSQNASVVISDGKRGVFNVTMKELEKKDAGWYWCSVGDLQAAVHINVTQRSTAHRNTAEAVTTPTLPMLHSAFSTFTDSTATSASKTNPSATVDSALTTSSYGSATPYPSVSVPYITIHSSTLTSSLTTVHSTCCPSTESTSSNKKIRNLPWHAPILIVLAMVLMVIVVMAAVNIYRSSRNNIRLVEGEMTELVINQDQ
ncbi:polymeric immunoglobulin receptor isoform X1 [Oncorhynchus kisutch]|uniref:polymeric immunoglobulin receptor isoform X1 n=1 Tax=Oncorhynchus kisutch TaxID=8019 RepID=UPI00099FEBDB|nr:polymeric immunoglobulin receptor isoform X1 [Oncorhynchus kisutch]XP_020348259.1 polymeric immunoglobulin receptor isoform X1 [Oncorhynchus kisutch]